MEFPDSSPVWLRPRKTLKGVGLRPYPGLGLRLDAFGVQQDVRVPAPLRTMDEVV